MLFAQPAFANYLQLKQCLLIAAASMALYPFTGSFYELAAVLSVQPRPDRLATPHYLDTLPISDTLYGRAQTKKYC